MLRSMFAGVSGMQNHQLRMDAIGNNIANVNTVGYKTSRVTFQDALSQTIRGATAPQGNRGGINALQIGLGMSVASIDVLHTQGNLQTTGKITDLAIEGDGFFILSDGNEHYYTRAGMFALERDGRLVYPSNGLLLQGWMADHNGVIDTNQPLTAITLPIGATIEPTATTSINFTANLNAALNEELSYGPNPFTVDDGAGNEAQVTVILVPTGGFNQWNFTLNVTGGSIVNPDHATGVITLDEYGNVISVVDANGNPVAGFQVAIDGGGTAAVDFPSAGNNAFVFNGTPVASGQFTPAPPVTSTVEVYDSQGNIHLVTTVFTKVGDNQWEWSASTAAFGVVGSGTLTFDNYGKLTGVTGGPIQFSPPGAAQVTIDPDFSKVTQYVGESTVAIAQDGYPMGDLDSFTIDKNGRIIGVFTNGLTRNIAQLAVATFNNPAGLERIGETMFRESSNSGSRRVAPSGVGGSGTITPGALEMSNVDLSQEFTEMIITQRGFQANSRIITTSDEILQELVNLKR